MDGFIKSILDLSVTASYIAIAVAILRFPLKKAPRFITVLLWALVAVRLMVPTLPESKLSLIPDAEPITSVTQKEDVTETVPPTVEENEGVQQAPPLSSAPQQTPILPDTDDTETETEPQPVVTPEKPSPWRIAFWVWVAGVGAMMIYAFISWRRVLSTVREAVPTEGRVWVCDGIDTPFICGLFRPRIYLPSLLSAEDAKYVTSHEEAHIKRGDHLWKPLGFLLLSLHWFNPVMWLAYILLCKDIELATDEKAIAALGEEHKKLYSSALINCAAKRPLISACPLAFGENGVKSRVKAVLNYKKPAFWIIIVAVIVCIATSIIFLTNPKKDELVDEGSSEASADSKDEAPAEDLVVGTWYGVAYEYKGESFRFDEDGKGIYVNCYGEETAILWRIEEGEFFIEEQEPKSDESAFHSPYGCVLNEDGLELYHYCDCPSIRLSRSKWEYGGNDKLIEGGTWVNDGKTLFHSFNEDGTGNGTISGEDVSYNWLYNEAREALMFFKDGETYSYSCRIYEDYLELDLGGFVFKMTPLSSDEDESSYTESTDESGDESSYEQYLPAENVWTLDGDVLTVSGSGYMTAPPDWAVANKTVRHLVIEDGLLSVYENAFSGYTALESVTLPDSIKEIGKNAFKDCVSLTEVALPANIGNLEGDIFNGCTRLEKIKLPQNMKGCSTPLFAECPAIKEVVLEGKNELFFTIDGVLFYGTESLGGDWAELLYYPKAKAGAYTVPAEVNHIDEEALKNCTGLTALYIKGGVSSCTVYDKHFEGCTALEEVQLPRDIKHIGADPFIGCTSFKKLIYVGTRAEWENVPKHPYWQGERVHTVKLLECKDKTVDVPAYEQYWTLTADGTFTLLSYGGDPYEPLWKDDKDKIKKVIIKDGVTRLPSYSFEDCVNLTSVSIPDSVVDLGSWTFSGCSSLKEISLPDGITRVGGFSRCTSLEKVKLPANLEILSLYAFTDCVSLKTISLPNTLKTIDQDAFLRCTGLESIHIPSSVTEIGPEVFLGCTALKTVTGGENVETVGYGTFEGCAITDISFLKKVTKISNSTFELCTSLKTAVLPKNISEIPMRALYGSAVETVHISKNVTKIDSQAFQDCNSFKTIIYDGTVEEWAKVSLGVCWLGYDHLAMARKITVKCKDGTVTAKNNVEGDIDYGPGCGGVY